jgi:hypothetical protein
MKKIYFILLIITISRTITAQVGGISASKLATICTNTVPNKGIEFEPSFGIGFAKKAWDSDGKSNKLYLSDDSTKYSSGFNFRFTYGALKNWEIGMSVGSDIETISLGTKYKLLEINNTSVGILAGFKTPFGNQARTKQNNLSSESPAVVGGLILCRQFNDNLSLDANFQYQFSTVSTSDNHKGDYFVNADLGYYLPSRVQLLAGVYYSKNTFSQNENNAELFTIQAGTTIERSEKFILVLFVSQDIFGKNNEQTTGFGMALTIPIL